MLSDYTPIVYDTPKEFNNIELYLLHDLHKGSAQFNEKKWESVKQEILGQSNRYCVFVGDAMENAVPGSKSDIWDQTMSPQEQKEWVMEQFIELKDRIIAVIDGNHERNRTTKLTSLYPLYDCALFSGLSELYRPHFAFCDIGVGTRSRDHNQQVRYFVYLVHKARDTKMYSSADMISGIDIFVSGHDHSPKCVPRARLNYDPIRKIVSVKTVEVVNSGSFLSYGGYATDNAYRPNAETMYKLILSGGDKGISTIGYYL